MTTTTRPPVEIDPDKLMSFVFRAVDEVGAALNAALVVMGDQLGYYRALAEHGPSAQHRWSYANVAAAARRHGLEPPHRVARGVVAAAVVQNGTTPQTSGGRLATRRGADSMITRAEA